MARRKEGPPMSWIVWDRERRSIWDYGTQNEMENVARTMNEMYQTDAYQARMIED